MIPTCIVSLTSVIWFHRAYKNLHHRIPKPKYNASWGYMTWIIPYVQMYMPYLMMKEMWTETVSLVSQKNKNSTNKSVKIVRLWWLSCILVFLSQSRMITMFYFFGTGIIPYVEFSFLHVSLLLAIQLFWATISIKLIREYSQMENELEKIKTDDRNL